MEIEFPIDAKSDEEIVDTLIRLIAEQITGVNYPGTESRNKHLLRIKNSDPLSYKYIEKFLEAFTVYSFLKNDRDLRLKGMDVWKQEKERHKGDFSEQLEKLLRLADEKKWRLDPIRNDLQSI